MLNECARVGCEKYFDMVCDVLLEVDGIERQEKIKLCYGCYEEELKKEGEGRWINKNFISLGDIDMSGRKKYFIMTVKDMKNLKKVVRAFT